MQQEEKHCIKDCRIEGYPKNYAINESKYANQWEIITKENVKKYWGEPEKIYTENGMENWLYTRHRWVGVTIAVIIPVPLILPVGTDTATISFNGKEFVQYRQKTHFTEQYLCSILPSISDPGGFCGHYSQHPPFER